MPSAQFFKGIRTLMSEVDWQAENWGKGKGPEPVSERIETISKHLNEAAEAVNNPDYPVDPYDKLRIIAGIIFPILTRPEAKGRK